MNSENAFELFPRRQPRSFYKQHLITLSKICTNIRDHEKVGNRIQDRPQDINIEEVIDGLNQIYVVLGSG